MTLRIDDPDVLNAMLRAIVEAKFHPQPEDTLLWGSPLVAKAVLEVFNAAVTADEKRGRPDIADESRKWQRSLMANAILPVVRKRLREDAKKEFWRKYSASQKQSYVLQCISPFLLDPANLAQLVNEAEV
jgi:hypothetical protein